MLFQLSPAFSISVLALLFAICVFALVMVQERPIRGILGTKLRWPRRRTDRTAPPASWSAREATLRVTTRESGDTVTDTLTDPYGQLRAISTTVPVAQKESAIALVKTYAFREWRQAPLP